MALEKGKEKEGTEEKPADNWYAPSEIVSAAYQSLDEQVQKLDEIPGKVQTDGNKLLNIILDRTKDIFRNDNTIKEFTTALLDFDEGMGHAMHMVITLEENERNGNRPEPSTRLQLPQINLPTTERTTPNIIIGSEHPQKKGGLFDYLGARSTNRMIEKLQKFEREQEQPEITTSKVKNVKAYGEEIQSEWLRLIDFYDKSKKRIYFFHDPETLRNQREEISTHLTKMIGIVRAFSRAIVEYRKERFGDRKVGVAAGAMWLEAAKARLEVPGWGGGTIATSAGATSQTIPKRPRGGPYTSEMSSGVTEHE
jgi:hypothetical protein